MQLVYTLILSMLIISCSDNRQGIPENERNYSKEAAQVPLNMCYRDGNPFYEFHHINADTIARAICAANRKYFGPAFDTPQIRDSIYDWLRNEYFSTKTYGQGWQLGARLNESRFTTTYHDFYSLESLGIGLHFDNMVCLTSFISYGGTYAYSEQRSGNWYSHNLNKFKVTCDFHIYIQYTPPARPFSKPRQEYYNVTIKDTVDLFTIQDEAYYREYLSYAGK